MLKVNIRTSLINEYSKANTMRLVAYIDCNQTRFDELIDVVLDEDKDLEKRAAWVLGHSGTHCPDLAYKHFRVLIDKLKTPDVGDSAKRNTLRVWQFLEIPEEYIGEVTDMCFDFLMSTKEPIAIKVFSMSILSNIVQKIPELKNELRLVIEDQMPYGSAGFKSRGNKILKGL